MLRELHISNLAVIADATIEFSDGLNCFTGQTGAGKSLVIGALELLLGLRSPQGMLRAGAAESRVTGVFHISDLAVRGDISALADVPLADEPELIISRRIFSSARTSASINGHPISGQTLRNIGERLADIHGQNDFQFLMRPANQLAVLDQFANAGELADAFRTLHARRSELRTRQQELAATQELRRGRLELAEFQLAEIETLAPVDGEMESLEQRHKTLANAAEIKKQALGICGELYDDEQSAIERLKRILAAVSDVAELSADYRPVFEQMRDAVIALDDAAFSMRHITDRVEIDDEALAECAERLNEYHRLIHKYCRRGDPSDALIRFHAHLITEVTELKSQQAGGSNIAREIERLELEMTELGSRLSTARRAGAVRIAALVSTQLGELGMKDAIFNIAATPITAEPQDRFPSPAGCEMVEFLIAPNPGQPARPLRQTASGGEVSRVMLALKSILSSADRLSVLVFDEVDANVGGRMGLVIGEKLQRLADAHQVLCITHLPQIAAFARRHMRIGKSVVDGNSFSQVQAISGEESINELAEMITGKEVTPTARQQARELLAMAAKAEQKRRSAPPPPPPPPPPGPAASPTGAAAQRPPTHNASTPMRPPAAAKRSRPAGKGGGRRPV